MKKLLKYKLELYATPLQYAEIKLHFSSLPIDLILSGLRFSNNRYKASVGGYLNPGRKSIIKRETYLITRKQASLRLKNWKVMIKKYRDKGYSYPTISRIKRQLMSIVTDN